MSVYNHSRPVAGKAFVGREVLMRSLQLGVRHGRSFAVCGGPKSGRTSVLQHMGVRLRQRWAQESRQVKLVPVYIDVGGVVARSRARVPPSVPRLLWDAISAAVLSPEVFGDATPVRVPEPKLHDASAAWVDLTAALDELWRRLQGQRGWCRYVLLVDGGDTLLTPPFEAAARSLMALTGDRSAFAPAATVIAGGRLLYEHASDDGSPWMALRPLALGALREDEARTLVRRGLPEGAPDLLSALMHATGKHPYLLQRLLAALETRPDAPIDDVINAARDDCAALFNEIWATFDRGRGVTYRGAYAAPEHALMQFLLDFGGPASLAAAERELGIRPLKEYAQFLQYAGVVERTLRGDLPCYRAACDLWNIWYSERILR